MAATRSSWKTGDSGDLVTDVVELHVSASVQILANFVTKLTLVSTAFSSKAL
jgi:hypothetical protein